MKTYVDIEPKLAEPKETIPAKKPEEKNKDSSEPKTIAEQPKIIPVQDKIRVFSNDDLKRLINVVAPEEYNKQDNRADLDDLVSRIEPRSFVDEQSNKQFHFDESLTLLRSRGYDRHLRPAEAMSVLINYDDNQNLNYKNIARNMHSSCEEWLSLVLRISNDSLFVYLDPENLMWSEKFKYVLKGNSGRIKCSEELRFKMDASKIKYQPRSNHLKDFPNEFIELFFGRKLEELDQLRYPGKIAIYLSKNLLKGDFFPVSCRYDKLISPELSFLQRLFINYDVGFKRTILEKYKAASRGIREAKSKQ